MSVVKDIGPDGIELFNASTVDLTDDLIHQKDKVENTLTAQMEEVQAGNGEEIKY